MRHNGAGSLAAWMLLGAMALLALGGCAREEFLVQEGNPYMLPGGQQPSQKFCSGAPSQTWAVVVGVNFYKDERIADLGGAVNDAWSFYHYLASPNGARVDAFRRRLLLNDEATYSNVINALGNFVRDACPQDQIIIYFAGHGAHEDPESPEAFLLVHDTDLDNMVGTAVSMSQLPKFLEWRAGQTGRLLMLIDACHSGNIQFPGKRGVKPVERYELVNESLSRLVDDRPGWGAISATAPDQLAGETASACTINGHAYKGGLFTCRMLEALSGRGDVDGDGQVSLKELYGHIKSMVAMDTGRQQVPQLSGNLAEDTIIAKAGQGLAQIPRIPEVYLSETRDQPLRPYAWGLAGLTGATLLTAVALTITYQIDLKDFDNREDVTVTLAEQLQAEDDFAARRGIVYGAYAAAGALSLMTLSAFLWDELDVPEGRSEVYQDGPWFQIGVAPTADGPAASFNLRLRY